MDGADGAWLPGKPNTVSEKTGWYQRNLHILSRAAQESNPLSRQGARSSRFERWISQGKVVREALAGGLQQPESLQ